MALFPSRLFRITALLGAVSSAVLVGQDRRDEPSSDPAEAVAVWSASDTRLANHYIQLLQKDPVYGQVLDLLWDLYRKKEQTPLLLEYFEKASASGPGVAWLIHGHLLRKAEKWDEARAAYEEILEKDPSNRHALLALAEFADREGRIGRAISLYQRLSEVVPVNDEDGVAFRLRKATLHRMQGQLDRAVATWEEVLAVESLDSDIRSGIVSQLLEAGGTEIALGVLEEMAGVGRPPRERLEALAELTRVHEFTGDFSEAVEAARRGLSLLHFRNHEYGELFARLVQIHERHEELSELENSLRLAIDPTNPTERSLHDLVEFYRLVADSEAEEEAVQRLSARMPGNLNYRLRLTRLQMENDRYEDAAATLEDLLSGETEVTLSLVFLRAQIALKAEGRRRAEEVIVEYLGGSGEDPDEIREIIEFARKNYLDSLVEQLLRERIEGLELSEETRSASVELARFLHERGREEEALEVLRGFVESGEALNRVDRVDQLYRVALVFRDFDEADEALRQVEAGIDLDPENSELLMARVDLLIAGGEVDAAVAQLEEIWESKTSFHERTDVDQRIFSLLRSLSASEEEARENLNILPGGAIQTLAQYRRMAAAASQAAPTSDETPPPELIAYYEAVKVVANEQPSTARRYRAAWWAMKLQDNPECYAQLTRATEEAGGPVIEVEKMLLELAVMNERTTLMARHLANLAEIDPENADEYLRRRAEARFELGFEDEAVRELRRLAAIPGASLGTLDSLARVYQKQGSRRKRAEVWQQAFREADILEKRRIVGQLSTTFIENGEPEEALKAQLELLEKETDLMQRRKQLDGQMGVARTHGLLDWLLERYGEFARSKPFDRFFPEAIARIHVAAGNEREAFEAMKTAYYLSGRDEALLNELGQLADRLGDLKSAIYYRRQLLAREESTALESWQGLIDMLERDLQVGEADTLRERLEIRFGSDPEFLEEMAGHYRDAGDLASAERNLARLAELRHWDPAPRFQLGLIQLARGKEDAAAGLFEEVLEATKGVEYPEGFAARALPLLRVETLPPEDRAVPGNEFTSLVFAVEDYPFLGGSLQDDMAEALQRSFPEFEHAPSLPHLIRLRALEESADLAAKRGNVEAWLEKHASPDLPLHERLWSARYAGAGDRIDGILKERPESEDPADLFLSAYCRVLGGEVESLLEWAGTEGETQNVRSMKERFAVLSAFLLLSESRDDPLRDEEVIFRIFEELPVHPTVGAHIFSELRKAGDYSSSYRAGALFAREILGDDGNFLFHLSQVAEWAGRLEERVRYLDDSLTTLNSTAGSRGAGHFYAALTERLGLFRTDEERLRYLAELREAADGNVALTRSDLLERKILIALAGEQYAQVIEGLGSLMKRQIDVIRPRSSDADQVRSDQVQSWQRMSQLLRYYADRIPLTRGNEGHLLDALSGFPVTSPGDESVLAEYERFEIDRKLLGLQIRNAQERDALVDRIHGILREPDSRLELARALQSLGYHREAIPVYRFEAELREREYFPLQGLFEACNEALEPGPALELISRINGGEFPSPPGLTAEYLAEQNARFLLISRKTERLASLGRPFAAREGSPPMSGRSHLPYELALVETYRLQGDDASLFPLLADLRERGAIEPRQGLLAAEVLARRGEYREALEWIAATVLGRGEPNVERRALREAVRFHAALGNPDPGEVVKLARIALDSHPASFAGDLAEEAFSAGAREEAIAILQLLRRKASSQADLTAVTGRLIRLKRVTGADWADLEDEWERFFHQFEYQAPKTGPGESAGGRGNSWQISNAAAFLTWICADPEDLHGLSAVLAGIPAPPRDPWIRDLLLAFCEGSLPMAAESWCRDADRHTLEKILETLPAFGSIGVEASREIVEKSTRPGPDFFPTQPSRQIAFFHRIGDKNRLIEVHQSYMREARSDLFRAHGVEPWFPTLASRQELPSLFAAIGESDLAARLFHRYHETIIRYAWVHQTFLEDYLEFLIQEQRFADAEAILKNASQKTIRLDLRLLLRLYADWGKLDEWEMRVDELHLSEGRLALLRDWSAALAEGREMVEYTGTW